MSPATLPLFAVRILTGVGVCLFYSAAPVSAEDTNDESRERAAMALAKKLTAREFADWEESAKDFTLPADEFAPEEDDEGDDDDPSVPSPATVEDLQELLRAAPGETAEQVMFAMLKPEPGHFAVVAALQDWFYDDAKGPQLNKGQANRLNQALQTYVSWHAAQVRDAPECRARYQHLDDLTGAWASFAKIYSASLEKIAAPPLPKNALSLRDPWVPQEAKDQPIPYHYPPTWAVDGDGLLWYDERGGDKLFRLDLKNMNWSRLTLDEDDNPWQAMPSGSHVISHADWRGCFACADPERKKWKLLQIGLYSSSVTSGDRTFVIFSAPNHAFPDIEESPNPPPSRSGLETSLKIWDFATGEKREVPDSPKSPWLGHTEYQTHNEFATESGRLVVAINDRNEASPVRHYRTIYAATDKSASEFKELFQLVDDNYAACGWSGSPDKFLLLRPPSNQSFEFDPAPVDCAMLCDPDTRTVEQLFVNTSALTFPGWRTPKGWSVAGSPRWELPASLQAPPPGVITRWQKVFHHRGRLYILSESFRPGRESRPSYRLYQFRPGKKSPGVIPLTFEFSPGVVARMKRLEKMDHHPGALAELDPLPLPADTYLAFVTSFGVFRIPWTELEKALPGEQ